MGDIKTDEFVVQTGHRNKKRQVLFGICLFFIFTIPNLSLYADQSQIYEENFDETEANATVHGVNGWAVTQGASADAVTESAVTPSGSGKSLAIAPAETSVKVNRSAAYGELSPAWIDMTVRPGIGAQDPPVPSSGIGAVIFSSAGTIEASDLDTWTTLGIPFDPEAWVRVLMKVDFVSQTYDVYVSEPGKYKTPFVPDRAGLRFTDTSIHSLNSLGFSGTFKKSNPYTSYADNIRVHFIERVQIITPEQELVKGRPSETIWIQLQNSNGEPQKAFEEVQLNLRSSSTDASFSLDPTNWEPTTQVILPVGQESVKVYYMDQKQGNPMIQVNEEPERGWLEASQQMTVKTAGHRFVLSTTASHIAGESFAMTVTAKDENGVLDETYGGTLLLTPEYLLPLSGTKTLFPAELTGFQKGVLETVLAYPDAGSIEIIATDQEENEKSGSSGPVHFLPHSFAVSADQNQIVGKPFQLSVQAKNANGEITPNYSDDAQIVVVPKQPESGGALTPSSLTGDQFHAGSADIQSVYSLWGTVQIRVQDAAAPTQQGVSGDITFLPKALKVTADMPPDGRSFFYVGEAVTVKIQAVDFNDKPIENFTGLLSVTSAPDLGLPPQISMELSDRGSKQMVIAAPQSGSYVISAASAETHLSASSTAISVRDATLQVISTSAPVGTAEIQIELIDDQGKRIKDSKVAITIKIHEENPNGSAISSATERSVLFNNGVAIIDIADLESETITIVPQSLLGFKIRQGTITFGRIGKSGIGALMWWEAKDEIEKNKEKEQALRTEEQQEHISMLEPKRSDSDHGN